MRPAATTQDTLERPIEHPTDKSPSAAAVKGSTNVEICGQPAARAHDDWVPWPTQPSLQIASGSASIMVNGKPLVGHRDQIANADAIRAPLLRTVWINAEKVPALPCMCEKPEESMLGPRAKRLLRKNAEDFRKMVSGGDVSSLGMLGAFLQEHTWDLGTGDGFKDVASMINAANNRLKVESSGDDEYIAIANDLKDFIRELANEHLGTNLYAAYGYGSMKIETGRAIFQNHTEELVQQFPETLKGFECGGDTKELNVALAAVMSTPKGAIAMGELHMQDVKAQAKPAGLDLSMYPPESRVAFFNDCWRQGPDQVIYKWQRALLEGRLPMLGEGCATCHQLQEILDILNEGLDPDEQISFPTDPR